MFYDLFICIDYIGIEDIGTHAIEVIQNEDQRRIYKKWNKITSPSKESESKDKI